MTHTEYKDLFEKINYCSTDDEYNNLISICKIMFENQNAVNIFDLFDIYTCVFSDNKQIFVDIIDVVTIYGIFKSSINDVNFDNYNKLVTILQCYNDITVTMGDIYSLLCKANKDDKNFGEKVNMFGYMIQNVNDINELFLNKTVLMYVALHSKRLTEKFLEIVLSMPNANVNKKNSTGWSAYMFASRFLHIDSTQKAVKMLLSVPNIDTAEGTHVKISDCPVGIKKC